MIVQISPALPLVSKLGTCLGPCDVCHGVGENAASFIRVSFLGECMESLPFDPMCILTDIAYMLKRSVSLRERSTLLCILFWGVGTPNKVRCQRENPPQS